MKGLKKTLLFMMSVLVFTMLKSTTGLAETVVSSITLTDASGNQTQIITEDGDVSDTGWSYDATSNTLTLSGWSGQNIKANGDINLVLSGTNTITLANENKSKAIEGTTFNVSGSSDSDKLLIQGNLTKSFYGIYASLTLGDNAHIKIDISSSSTDDCYGYFSGYVTFAGSNSSIDSDVTAGGKVQALSGINAINNGSVHCGDGNTVNASAKSTGPCEAYAIGSLSVSKTNPVITASATNDGTKPNYCFGVHFTDLLFTEGGKLDVTGMVSIPLPNCSMDYFSRNIVTTTPADNKYYWDIIDNRYYYKNVLFNLDGTVCYHTVFEYSATPADTVWYGDDRFTLPGGKVGDSLKDNGYSFYLTDYLRGLDSYRSDARFSIKSGSLPEGISLNPTFGSISGTFSKECPAGSVEITVKNTITNNSIDFTLNYGAVVEADRNITIGGVNYNTKTDASGTGWSYTAADTTLTLNNYSGGKISTEIALNIVLKGTNVITLKDEDNAIALDSANSDKISISGEKSTDKLTIQGDLTKSFKAVNAYLSLKDNAHVILNIKSTTTTKSYGSYKDIYLNGDNASLDVNVTSAGAVVGLSSIQAAHYGSSYSGAGNVVNVTAKSTGAKEVAAIDFLYVYNTNPVITVSATNDGTKPDYCYGVGYLNDLKITAGGKLDATGQVCTNTGMTPANINRNIVTTTPANNAYYWKIHTGAREKYTIYNTDGTICYKTVFEYASTPADLVWYGEDFTLPGGKVGDSLSNGGDSFYLTNYIRGLDGYYSDSTFKIKSGSLPEGITFNLYYGSLFGTFTKKCDAGSVEITVTNNTTKNSIDFTLNYDAVTSAKPVTGLTLSDTSLSVGIDNNKAFTATITPTDASDKSISAESSDTDIATVSVGAENADGTRKIYVYGHRVGTATITVTANDTNLKKQVTVSVKNSVPNARIDYINEKFTGLVASAEYSVTVDEVTSTVTASESGTIDIPESYMGKTISIVKKGSVAAENSDSQEIAVPARPVAPANCSFVKPTNKNALDGTLVLGATYREYKLESATEWKKAYTSTEIPYLGIGTYKVRDAANETRFTGLAATVTIVARDLAFVNTTGLEIPSGSTYVSISGIELINYVEGGKPTYTFTKVSGPDWITVSTSGYIGGAPTEVSMLETTLTVKVTDEDSVEKTLNIPVGVVLACAHIGGQATCTEYAKCSICNQPYGALASHDWKAATCTEAKKCTREGCNAKEGAALGHDYADATCEAPKTCKRCPVTEGEVLPHDWKDATCTAPKKCKNCSATEGSALDHIWKDATCTEAKKCTREGCNAKEGATLGHDYADATCEAPKTCKRCPVTEGEALGHDWKYATCSAPSTCKRCSKTTGDPATEAHKEISANNAVAATCIAEGKESDTKCEYCGKKLNEGAVIAKKAHTAVNDLEVPATCTQEGKTAGKHCSVCNTVIEGLEVIPAKGHRAADPVITPATTKKDGSSIKKCSVCSEVLATDAIPKAYVVVEETAKYTGKAVKQTVKVTDKDGKAISKDNYKLTYKNNTKIGKATVTITFSNNYAGKVSKTFNIVNKSLIPSKVSGVKLTAGSKSFKASWKKGSAVTDGYEIQYSTDKNFLTAVKSVKVTKADTLTKEVKKLKAKTDYYVRIRAYNKDGKTTAYSAWTAVKKAVKTR